MGGFNASDYCDRQIYAGAERVRDRHARDQHHLTVETEPSGASVKTSNQFACDATPCTFKMPRKSEFGVTISKDGYKTWTGQVTTRVSGAGGAGMAGNVLVGGVIGAGVDVATGAMLDLDPNPLVVKLEPQD
jgi:hypothetical protein|tara:strand:- start:474 stop:869 length:396 start_codon:yes stop_codon:yes gene_type:complete